MKKRILALMMTFVIAFSFAVPAFAGKEPVSTIKWQGESDKAVAANIDAVQNNTRKNASGPKITSNAHSADFPGIYFIWDSKQKDNGYLKVEASVFNDYESFTLTSKEANTYWDFVIQPQVGQGMTDDDCYVFFIPKVYNNKNINMVFIGDIVDRCSDKAKTYTVGFYAYDEEGKPVHKFNMEVPKGKAIDWTHDPMIQELWGDGGYSIEHRWNGNESWNRYWGINYDIQVHTGDWLVYDAKTGKIGNQYVERGEWADDDTAQKTYGCVDIIPAVRYWELSYEKYLAYVEIWNDIYLEHGAISDIGQKLSASGGLAHYYALLKEYGAASLPPYYHFDYSMVDLYEEWAEELEPGLEEVCGLLGIDLKAYVENHVSNINVQRK